MTIPEQPDDYWRKASYSSSGQDCVELNGSLTAVRDSKNGDVLRLDRLSVATLLDAARQH